jgi:hypothetical protein
MYEDTSARFRPQPAASPASRTLTFAVLIATKDHRQRLGHDSFVEEEEWAQHLKA